MIRRREAVCVRESFPPCASLSAPCTKPGLNTLNWRENTCNSRNMCRGTHVCGNCKQAHTHTHTLWQLVTQVGHFRSKVKWNDLWGESFRLLTVGPNLWGCQVFWCWALWECLTLTSAGRSRADTIYRIRYTVSYIRWMKSVSVWRLQFISFWNT